MRHILKLIVFVSIGFSVYSINPTNKVRSFEENADEDYMKAEVIIKLTKVSDLVPVAEKYGLDPTPICQWGMKPIYRLRITNGSTVSQTVAALLNDTQQRVVYANPNYVVSLPVVNKDQVRSVGNSWSIGNWGIGGSAKGYVTQWFQQVIRLDAAHKTSKGEGVKIAVLDTGVDKNHPALAGRLLPGYDVVDYDHDASEEGAPYQGAYGHGTHVAGLIAKVAPEAKIIPIRVLDQDGIGNVWVLAEGLMHALDPDENPRTNDGANIINLSLGTVQKTELLSSLLAAGINDGTKPDAEDFSIGHPGIIVVAGAGNSGDTTPHYPAAENFEGLIAVGASNSADKMSDFSTRGDWVDVLAPGERIVSSLPNGRYGTWRGTSMSTPIVSGIVALVKSAFPTMSPKDVEARIRQTSVAVPTETLKRRVDAERALTITPEK